MAAQDKLLNASDKNRSCDDDNKIKWEQELINRIDQIEENSRDIKSMTKKDIIVATVITAVCLLLVIVGAYIS